MKSVSASQVVIWLFLRVKQVIIPHLKEESLSYMLIVKILNFHLKIAILRESNVVTVY